MIELKIRANGRKFSKTKKILIVHPQYSTIEKYAKTHQILLSPFRAGDRMAVPPCGWRVPYVIVYGEPGRPLINSVRNPLEVTAATDIQARPNAVYYITKVFIPVLNRCAHCWLLKV